MSVDATMGRYKQSGDARLATATLDAECTHLRYPNHALKTTLRGSFAPPEATLEPWDVVGYPPLPVDRKHFSERTNM
jgi:hypothetical protein